MSLYGAMFSGVSGLKAQSQAMGIISDNITNVNTTGYKTNKASFATLVTSQVANSYAPGGVRSSALSMIDQQGLIQSSANATDLAIVGNGFFVVSDTSAATATTERLYTRAGAFTTDASGYLRSASGHYLQGWATDAAGVPTATNPAALSSLEAIRVNSATGNARATASIGIGVNLPASAAVAATETTNVQVFDSLGVSHDVTLSWTKLATNSWRVDATATGAGTIDEGAVGAGAGYSVVVNFNGDGTPATFDGAATPPALAIGGWTSGAANSVIAMNLGTQNTANGVTQFSSTYSASFINQDGIQFGNFFGVRVDENGIVNALYDNGETLSIYKLPISTFANANGLEARSGSAYAQSERSGTFTLRNAGEGSAGKVAPSSLEASTTDIAEQFTNMIVSQRAYSASAKIVTTADEMLDELIRIKR